MKHKKITNKVEELKVKNYTPDERLVNWFDERLELEKERRQLKPKRAGGKLPTSFQKKVNRSGANKSILLHDIIFQSMANLIYFFESVAADKTLRKLFEKDMIKLLDPRFTTIYATGQEIYLNPDSSYFSKKNNFARLVASAISSDWERRSGEPTRDFRISILYQLQIIVRDYVLKIMEKEYGPTGQITKSASSDFGNAVGWLALIAKAVSDVDTEYDRRMGF